MQKLEKAALDLGKSTAFSASEVAAGFQVLAQAGYDANTTVELTSKIINLAGAEMISFDKAAQITTDTIAQFGLSTNDVSTVINKFVTIGAASKTNVSELGEALSKVGAVANSAGYDLDEMLAALGSMAEAGTRGSEAGVALSGAIAQLLKPTDAAAQYLKDLNVMVMDGTGQMRPFNTIIKELSESGVTTAQMFEIFGREAGKYVVSMLNSTEAISRFQNILSGPLLDAPKMAGVQMEGLTGTWEQFGDAVSERRRLVLVNGRKGHRHSNRWICCGVLSQIRSIR